MPASATSSLIVVIASALCAFVSSFGGEGCGGSDSAKFNSEALDSHNRYRQQHLSGPLATSQALVDDAQETADKLASGAQAFAHDTARLAALQIGENMYEIWGSGYNVDGASAVKEWYDELKNPGYDFASPEFSTGTGHFTQVVWDKTTEVGCGAARSGDKCYVVCNYNPPGNYDGAFGTNVKRPNYRRSRSFQ